MPRPCCFYTAMDLRFWRSAVIDLPEMGLHTLMQSMEINVNLYQRCFAVFTVTSNDHIKPCELGYLIRIQCVFVVVIFSSVHPGHREDRSIWISFDVRKKTGHLHLENRTSWKWKEIKDDCTCYNCYESSIGHPLPAVLDIFWVVLSPDAVRHKRLQLSAAAD